MKKIYLDVCCLNRPFDDQSQLRIHLESEAVITVLTCVEHRHYALIWSEALAVEIKQNPDAERRQKVRELLKRARYHVVIGDKEAERARELHRQGFGAYDALHAACAETAGADVLLTTDDLFIRKAKATRLLNVSVCNPLKWIAGENL